ncbi:MAG TPA: hypothetical protein VK361_01460 [Rubrobacteraceae bacterium]|nr:hypothetical protein [Rubrobacteraceae bacterium]
MYWYNPVIGKMEDTPDPRTDARAQEMLGSHPDSEEFIEEYWRWREKTGVVAALVFTGQKFQRREQGLEPPR